MVGMSVVGSDFEELRQFNLAELYDPTPKPDAEKSDITPKEEERDNSNPEANPEAEKDMKTTAEEAKPDSSSANNEVKVEQDPDSPVMQSAEAPQ